MMQPPPVPASQPATPVFESGDARVFVDSVQCKMGIYDPRFIDGVEFGRVEVPVARLVRDLAGAVTWTALVAALIGAEQLLLISMGALFAGQFGWWWTGQKHAATILVRGASVQLAVTDEATAKRICHAVLQVVQATRR